MVKMVQTETQAVLDTLTFRMHLKNSRVTGIGMYMWKGATLRVMKANRIKESF